MFASLMSISLMNTWTVFTKTCILLLWASPILSFIFSGGEGQTCSEKCILLLLYYQ